MNPLDALFSRLRSTGRKTFLPFVTAGDPSLEQTGELLDAIITAGADVVEIGFPYSDPIADGAVIQASYTRALQQGIKLEAIFRAVPVWRQKHPNTPLLAMVSYSIVHRRGVPSFLGLAKQAGFAGLIIPDLPLEEATAIVRQATEQDLKLIQLVTPTTPQDRARQIVALSTGFVYVVSVTGITGERTALPTELRQQLGWLRSITDLPLCVGFGISRPEHVAMLRDVADGIIVGSALVRHLEKAVTEPWPKIVQQVSSHVASLRQTLDEGK
jgi:tryptophan synthase alpha chain